MNDDTTSLPSAYLDGNVTADERAVVEADVELLAAVERLRLVRAVVGDSEPAPISMRERHLAAALDAFDRLPAAERSGELRDATPTGDAAARAGAASVTTPISLNEQRIRRSQRSGRLLAAAAALVVIGGAGVIASSALRGGTDDGSDVAANAALEQAAEQPGSREALEVLAAEETFGTGNPQEVFTEQPAADAAVAADSPDDGLVGSDEPPPDDDLELLRSDADLALFANDLPATSPVADAPDIEIPAAFPLCDVVDRIVGPARWNGDEVVERLVVVGVDDTAGTAVAYDADTCEIVARTSLVAP